MAKGRVTKITASKSKAASSAKPESSQTKATQSKTAQPETAQPEFTMETFDGRTLRVARWRATEHSAQLPILFFNGIGANIEAVAPMAELLSDRDFVTFDMPGVGGSPDPVIPYNAVMMARIAALLLDKFNMPVVDVIGVSWGGAMAQQFALQNGSRVNKLILMATSAGMLMVPGNPAALMKMADPRRYIDPEFMNKHFKTLYGGAEDGKGGHISRITPPSKTGYFYQLIAMMGWTSAPFLPFMRKPTLIMMGGDDQIVPIANGKFLEMLIPNGELYEIKDGGHLFMLSHTEESISVIREFLDVVQEVKQAA